MTPFSVFSISHAYSLFSFQFPAWSSKSFSSGLFLTFFWEKTKNCLTYSICLFLCYLLFSRRYTIKVRLLKIAFDFQQNLSSPIGSFVWFQRQCERISFAFQFEKRNEIELSKLWGDMDVIFCLSDTTWVTLKLQGFCNVSVVLFRVSWIDNRLFFFVSRVAFCLFIFEIVYFHNSFLREREKLDLRFLNLFYCIIDYRRSFSEMNRLFWAARRVEFSPKVLFAFRCLLTPQNILPTSVLLEVFEKHYSNFTLVFLFHWFLLEVSTETY